MTLTDLIKEYRKKLEINPHDTSCLLFALQIPSICSRIEFPKTTENAKYYYHNGRARDASLYKAWLRQHYYHFINIWDTEMSIDTLFDNLYKLRNQVTHEGILMSNKSKFYFVESGVGMCIEGNIFLPVKRLCEDMFDAAKQTLDNHHEPINISLFDDSYIPSDTYKHIYDDTINLYRSFWADHSEDDYMLSIIYDHIIRNKPLTRKYIDTFFTKNPDAVCELRNFGRIYVDIPDEKERFIHKYYDNPESSTYRKVLRLNRQQYDRMLNVVKELNEFTEKHSFNIAKYIKK